MSGQRFVFRPTDAPGSSLSRRIFWLVAIQSLLWSGISPAGGSSPHDLEGGDTTPPTVTLAYPNGGETVVGGGTPIAAYSASDDVEVVSVDFYYRDSDSSPWVTIAEDESPTGFFLWYVQNTPTVEARFRIVARDAAGNEGEDTSSGFFEIQQTPNGVVPSTLRDFHLPGTQPFGVGEFQDENFCRLCHAGYDPLVEPATYGGSMMSHSARDPIFLASVIIAEQDAPSSGDQCFRCHAPMGWTRGRSNPTDGSILNLQDQQGVSCDVCHKLLDPIYEEGISPAEDVLVLEALDEVPTRFGEGQYVLDGEFRMRGPFDAPEAAHPWIQSTVHTEGDFCGTCHDVSNPVMEREGSTEWGVGPLDEAATNIGSEHFFPLERTYSEWKNSAFSSGPGLYRPEFAGNKPDGLVSSCQDCHMRDVLGKGCNAEDAPLRSDLPLHDLTGGNTWVPLLIEYLHPNDVSSSEIHAGIARAEYMLQNAALLDLNVNAIADSFSAAVTVTNRTGHKLPTGYPEGRRMWVNLIATDVEGEVVYESGHYDPVLAELTEDVDIALFEARLGLTEEMAALTSMTAGPSFHMVLSDTIYMDTRIPPEGYTQSAYETFGGVPVDPDSPVQPYLDGQYWHTTTYKLPPTTYDVEATLYYQTTSKEHIEFLRDANTTNDAGQNLYDLWVQFGKSPPELMATELENVSPTDVEDSSPTVSSMEWSIGPSPFQSDVAVLLTTARVEEVTIDVFDLGGRRIAEIYQGHLAPGSHRLVWDGKDDEGRDTGSGIYWIRVASRTDSQVRKAVRLR